MKTWFIVFFSKSIPEIIFELTDVRETWTEDQLSEAILEQKRSFAANYLGAY